MSIADDFISQLKEQWKGPAVEVSIKDKVTVFGKGDPRTKLTIDNRSIVRRMLRNPSLAFGEAYMEGTLRVEGELLDILEGFVRTTSHLNKPPTLSPLKKLQASLSNRIGLEAARSNAAAHYDLGNDFYKLWLDPALIYTCAYYQKKEDSLAKAQQQKLELICQKARLKRGQNIIDLGCGWGGLIFHAAEKYGVKATGVVVAKEQGNYIIEEAKKRGLENQIEVQIRDWRQASGTYDRVFSVGVTEHVGFAHYDQWLQIYYDLLADEGIAFLHTIGRHPFSSGKDPWLRKYIFPGGSLPRLEQIITPAQQSGFTIVDLEDLWQHYAMTLRDWSTNFEKNVTQITSMYDEEFVRMWRLYLKYTEAAFRWGTLQLWQMVMIKNKDSRWPLDRQVNLDNLTD